MDLYATKKLNDIQSSVDNIKNYKFILLIRQ